MLHIFVPPHSLRSGDDVIGSKTAAALTKAGLPAQSHDLWPDSLSAAFNSGRVPFGRRIFRKILSPLFANRALKAVKSGDTFWILGFAASNQSSPRIEQIVQNRGAKYIFHVMDDWLSVPYLQQGTLARLKLADLVVVPTPELEHRIQVACPSAKVVRLEEPIDTQRVHPLPKSFTKSEIPIVVWCGNPGNLSKLCGVLEVLAEIQRKLPFRLRVISGKKPTRIDFNLDWEFLAYDYQRESELLAGARVGLAPLDDSPYNRCKGAYKIKTYMAAGLPTIASDLGYQSTLLEGEKCGILVNSPEDWKNALTRLL